MSKVNKLAEGTVEDGQVFQFANFAKAPAAKKGKKGMKSAGMAATKKPMGASDKTGEAPKKGK